LCKATVSQFISPDPVFSIKVRYGQIVKSPHFWEILGVQLCFRRFPIDGFSGK